MSEDYYDFEYLGFESNDSDEYQKGAFLYRFVSQRSHHRYLVRVELYINNLHCIKFYDESDGNFGDFSRITATFEPRRIFRTVANIGFEVFRKNRSASFMYIGAADYRDLKGWPTRRYRVYKAFIDALDIKDWFEVFDYDEQSMSVLVNLSEMPTEEDRQSFLRKIESFAGIISSTD